MHEHKGTVLQSAITHTLKLQRRLQGLIAETAGCTVEGHTVLVQAAQEALCEITGERADEQLLDRVFSTFCVGK